MKRSLFDFVYASFLVLAMSLGLVGCASVAPGESKVVVRAQQALKAADAVYAASMKFYFALPAQSLTAAEVKVFEAVRTGYDKAYKALDTGLDLYKAGKVSDLYAQQKALSDLLNQVLDLVAKYGGPLLNPVPPPVPSAPAVVKTTAPKVSFWIPAFAEVRL